MTDGKWVVHPRRVDHVRERSTTWTSETAQAQAVLDALERAHASGLGAVAVDGRMIDEALAVTARRTVARARRSAP